MMIEAPARSATRYPLSALRRSHSASVTLVIAAALAPAAATMGAAIDYGRAYLVASRLQGAADAGALAAVRARQVSGNTAREVQAVAAEHVRARLLDGYSSPADLAATTMTITGKDDPASATVTLRTPVKTALLPVIGIEVLNVSVSSVAELP